MTAEGKINWPVPVEFPLLRPREIHLWCAWLGQPDGRDPAATGELSADEITRANSFHFEGDRHRFVAARLNLRRVLAGYTGRDPASLVFSYGRMGKPMLVHRAELTGPLDPPVSNLTFNQSHGGAFWLLAVAWNQPVGVDVEEIRELRDLDLLENRLFSPAELLAQQSLPAAERQLAFFQRWTQREAAGKFTGLGFDPDQPFIPPDQGELLTPTEGYVGALAYGGAPVPVQRVGWNARLARPFATAAAPAASALPSSVGYPAPARLN